MSAGEGSVLVVGIPRSGSTWIGNVLGHAAGGELVHEPDNEKEHLRALVAKSGLGRFPVLRPGDSAPAYASLWLGVLADDSAPSTGGRRERAAARVWRGVSAAEREAAVQGRRSARTRLAAVLAGSPRQRPDRRPHEVPTEQPQRPDVAPRVVKSVHLMLAVEWLADLLPTTRVVLVTRHPANVLSSWLDMQLPDRDRQLDRRAAVQEQYLAPWGVEPPPAGADALARAAWQVCLLTAASLEVAARRPDLAMVSHDELCLDPASLFPALAGAVGLAWTVEAERFLLASDRPGDGYVVQRRAADQPDRWRTRLGTPEIRALLGAAEQFPALDRWLDDLRAPAGRVGQG